MVVALLGLLTSLGLFAARAVSRQAEVSATVSQLDYIRTALVTLSVHCEGLPVYVNDGDPGLVRKPGNMDECWQGPYLSRWPVSTPFGEGSFHYQGRLGSRAFVEAQGLNSANAGAVAVHMTALFRSESQLSAGAGGTWSVALPIGDYYQRTPVPVEPGE